MCKRRTRADPQILSSENPRRMPSLRHGAKSARWNKPPTPQWRVVKGVCKFGTSLAVARLMRTLHLVVGYDRSELSRLALAHAQAVAEGAVRAEIHVVEVLSLPMPDRGEVLAFSNEAALIELHGAGIREDLKEWKLPKHITFKAEVGFGDAAEVLCEFAVEKDADFIFVGTHGRKGLERLMLGSIAERTVRKAPCSVIVVRPKASDLEPKVEPPCADCTAVKKQKSDPNAWCVAHTHHAQRPMHLHYQYPEHFARGSMTLRFDE
jgi:nucleotide-binding universal stress UspA family protein